jgi:hypothetical protein
MNTDTTTGMTACTATAPTTMSDSVVLTRLTRETIANLQCPVCFQMCEPPLMSCPNGHFTCQSCLMRITGDTLKRKQCPQCRETGFIRNLPYEKMSTELLGGTELKCPHTSDDLSGCQTTYKYGELKMHNKVCKSLVQRYNCPCPRCTERNLYSLPELVEHVIINLGFNTDEEYQLNFLPSDAVGPLDALIGSIIVKIENSGFGRNLGMRLSATENSCSYSESPIINYDLKSDAYEGANTCVIYPPYDFFENFKKEDNLLSSISDSTSNPKSVTNLTFLIDTSQIYLVRTTCSVTSEMIFCDGTYLNSQYMDDDDPHCVYGFVVNYNYNSGYGKEDAPSSPLQTDACEPDNKRARRRTFDKIKYFDSRYIDFVKYTPEMSEEVLNGFRLELGANTTKKDALGQLRWCLVF